MWAQQQSIKHKQPGQWPFASKYDAVTVTPLVSFVEEYK